MSRTARLDLAHRFAAEGWRLFPQDRNKHPCIKDWPNQASSDPAQIQVWVKQFPKANYAVATGLASGIVVLDADVKNNQPGRESLAQLQEKIGTLPPTLVVRTGSGGGHIYFKAPPGIPIRSGPLADFPGLEVRAEGGCITLPGSSYADGRQYSVTQDNPVAECPAELVKILRSVAKKTPADRPFEDDGQKVTAGGRNQWLVRVAGSLRRAGLSSSVIEVALQEENMTRCEPPLENLEVAQIAASIGQKPAGDRPPGQEKIAKLEALLGGADNLQAIADHDFPMMRWVVRELLPVGVFGLLSGASKIGKTWLAQQLCSSVARGADFLGNPEFPCEQGEVLLLSLQLSPRQLHNRLKKAGIQPSTRVKVLTTFPRGLDALEAVHRWKAMHPACTLIVIDMLEQVRTRDPEHENTYSVNVTEIAGWSQLAAELDVAILGLAHNRKTPTEDFVSAVMGSVGGPGSAGVIWSLKRSRGQADAVLDVTGWDIIERDLPLVFDPSTAWRLLQGSAADHAKSKERDKIVQVLTDAGGPMSPTDIAAVLGKKAGAVRWLLCQLKKDPLSGVTQTERGQYIINDNTNILTHTPANGTNILTTELPFYDER